MKVSSSSRVVQNRSLWWHNGRALGLLSPRRKETVMKIFSCLDYQNIVCAAQLITSSRMKWFIFHQTNFYVSLRNSFFCYFCSLHRAILRKHQLIASHTDARHAFLCFNRQLSVSDCSVFSSTKFAEIWIVHQTVVCVLNRAPV